MGMHLHVTGDLDLKDRRSWTSYSYRTFIPMREDLERLVGEGPDEPVMDFIRASAADVSGDQEPRTLITEQLVAIVSRLEELFPRMAKQWNPELGEWESIAKDFGPFMTVAKFAIETQRGVVFS